MEQPPFHLTRRNWLRGLGAVGAALYFGRGTLAAQSAPAAAATAGRPADPERAIINLAGNENPFGPGREVVAEIMREAANSCRYPFREEIRLREEIAAIEGVKPEAIIVGNGGDEVLSMIGAIYGAPGKNLVASEPGYLQCPEYAERQGAHIRWIKHTASMQHDLPAMEAAIDADTSLVIVCNPDTPSGTKLEADALSAFIDRVSQRCAVLVDEAYLELVGDDYRKETQTRWSQAGRPVMVLRSFSKMYALAGLRIGYAVSTPEIIERLEKKRMSSLNYLGVAAARVSLRDTRFPAYSRRKIAEGRERFCALLDELKLPYTPSCANFVFHRTGIPIRKFQDLMREKGFFVGRPFPPYDDWVRISIGTELEMKRYAEAMRAVFATPPPAAAPAAPSAS